MMRSLLVVFLLLIAGCAHGPAEMSPAASDDAAAASVVPDTEIYLLEVDPSMDGVTLGEPLNVTNRVGYDNQPMFTWDGSILYTRMENDATDIWQVPHSGGNQRLTSTPESEYSPTPLRTGGISVVRVEEDGTQRLWRFDEDGTNPSLLFADLAPVGYHAWAGDHLVAFVLGDPHQLVLVRQQEAPKVVTEDIGRSLIPVSDEEVAFVQKTADGWWITILDVIDESMERVARLPEGREDFTIDRSGNFWTADERWILRWNPAKAGWERVRDYREDGLTDVTRMTFSRDGMLMAIVGSR